MIGAEPGGVKLKNVDTDMETKLAWSDIQPKVLVRFFDAVRNQDSATENFWLGYYCVLTENDAASIYFGFAEDKDKGPDMAKKIAEVQK